MDNIMSKKKRPTLQDVANIVGVTKMTVSRYLRDPSLVSSAIQAKIAVALEELGYIPNRAPDLLSHAKSHAIGILVPSLTNQVFSEVIRGIEKVTKAAGYQTMLAHYGYSAELEEERISFLLSYHIDGLILSDSYHTARTLKMIKTAGIPVIEMMDAASPAIEQAVGVDNLEAGYQMVSAMIGRGYKNIVYLGARLDARTQFRQQGYEKAMQEHGLVAKSVMTEAPSSFTLGAELLTRAMAEHPQTDGLFCTNDDLAVGAIFEAQRCGIKIPDQIAVAGFHGHNVGQSMVPKLATVITPREKIGQVTAEQLIARLNGQAIKHKVIDLGFKIQLGESI
ncbi:transcriptional regulator, LacI family [Psychromonas ingrahamii 37]|uniref:Transcriptional regulator, LacI family n=2 Tax=Psychromonas ingrahamii TaxID=357794 RepID=A1SYR6_PSYIN|nr:transcriptional regulator, LacI family [Psychromonas ingrahamii 37]